MAFEKLASYEATDWAKGDVITEAKLDKIENQLTILTTYAQGLSTDTSTGKITSTTGSTYNNSSSYIPTTKYVYSYVNGKINTLSLDETTASTIQTLTKISETDGKVSVEFNNIAITSTTGVGLVKIGNNIDVDANGVISLSTTGTNAYNASSNPLTTKDYVTNLIDELEVSNVTVGANKTLASIGETDGKISVSTTAISIPIAQINDIQLVNSYDFSANATNTITAANTIMTLDKFTGTISLTNTSTTTTRAISSLSYSNGVLTGKLAPMATATTTTAGFMSSQDKTRIEGLFNPEIPVENATATFVWISSVDDNLRSSGWITIDELKTLLGIGE